MKRIRIRCEIDDMLTRTNYSSFPLIISSIKKILHPPHHEQAKRIIHLRKLLCISAMEKTKTQLLPYLKSNRRLNVSQEKYNTLGLASNIRKKNKRQLNLLLEKRTRNQPMNELAKKAMTYSKILIDSKSEEYNFVGGKRNLEEKSTSTCINIQPSLALFISIKRHKAKHKLLKS